MKNTLVLGIGNRLMMDDGVGIYLVEAFQKRYGSPFATNGNTFSFSVGETDVHYCMDEITDADSVIIVDAADMGKNPGEVEVMPLHQIAMVNPGLSAHDYHLFHFLQALEQEGSSERKSGKLIGIQPYEINHHLGLSPTLDEKFEQVLACVSELVFA